MIDPERLRDPVFVAKFIARTRPGKWGCVDWVGRRRDGYGQVMCYGRTIVASRVAWMQHSGEVIPDHLTIDHLCCNPPCVNVDHLEVVSGGENSLRIHTGVPGWIDVGPPAYVRRRVRADDAWKYTATGRLRKVSA